MDEPQKFVIDRNRWRSGHNGSIKTGEGNTQLLNREGYMCCLGFISQQCGVPDDKLLGSEWPSETDVTFFLTYERSGELFDKQLVNNAVSINDDENIPIEIKEQQLIALFAAAGYELEFIGDYTK